MGTSVPSLRQSKRVMPPPSAGAISRRNCALASVMQPSRPAPPIATTDVDGPGRIGGSGAAASLERRGGATARAVLSASRRGAASNRNDVFPAAAHTFVRGVLARRPHPPPLPYLRLER